MIGIGKFISAATLAAAVMLGFTGCKDIPSTNDVPKGSNTWVVTVGMENSKFAGACPGAGLDAKRMTELLGAYANHIKAFSSETATKVSVTKAMKEAAENAELFIFFYSGHGGSEPFYDTGKDEVDGKDEFLCLYDTWMTDNEIWAIIKNCKGRFLMITDCCHSATMWRNPVCFDLARFSQMMRATTTENGPINMQCWSGCPDDTYSYGSSSGGMFTNALLKHFNPKKTYELLWTEIENDKDLQAYEAVQRTIMGDSFTARPVFQ